MTPAPTVSVTPATFCPVLNVHVPVSLSHVKFLFPSLPPYTSIPQPSAVVLLAGYVDPIPTVLSFTSSTSVWIIVCVPSTWRFPDKVRFVPLQLVPNSETPATAPSKEVAVITPAETAPYGKLGAPYPA